MLQSLKFRPRGEVREEVRAERRREAAEPSPATHAIWTVLKAGEPVYPIHRVQKTFLETVPVAHRTPTSPPDRGGLGAAAEAEAAAGAEARDLTGSARASVYVGAAPPLVPVCASVAWSLPSIVGLHVLTNDCGI